MDTLNAYDCPNCGKPTVCRHEDVGTTPMFLACRVTPGCQGRAVSRMYRAVTEEPTHEWYRPNYLELGRLSVEMRDHVMRGGLVLRAIV